MEEVVVAQENDGIVSASQLNETVHVLKSGTRALLGQKTMDEHENDQLMKYMNEEAHEDSKKTDTNDETTMKTTETTTDLAVAETEA